MIKLLLALALLSSCLDVPPDPVDVLPAHPTLAYPVVNTAVLSGGQVYVMTPAELEEFRSQVRAASWWMRRAEIALAGCGLSETTP